MGHKELTQQVQDLITEKYQERVTRTFQGLGKTMQHCRDNNQRVKKCGTTVTLLRTGRPPKNKSKCPWQDKELHTFLANSCCSLHDNNIPEQMVFFFFFYETNPVNPLHKNLFHHCGVIQLYNTAGTSGLQ